MRKMSPARITGNRGVGTLLATVTDKKVNPVITKAASLQFLQTSLNKTPAQAAKLLGT